MPNQPKRKNTRKTNTGYKYISKKGNKYRVCIGNPRVDKLFNTLEEAREYRDLFMTKEGYIVNE